VKAATVTSTVPYRQIHDVMLVCSRRDVGGAVMPKVTALTAVKLVP